MTKLLFAKALGGFSLSSTCLFSGAGGYYLMLDEKKVIEMRKIVDEGRIIENRKSKGTWTDMKTFSKSQVTNICTGNGSNGASECKKYIKANNVSKSVEQIFIFVGTPTLFTGSGPLYKFIYETEIDGHKEYQGQCEPTPNVEDKTNPCAKQNLPKGWTKEFISDFMTFYLEFIKSQGEG